MFQGAGAEVMAEATAEAGGGVGATAGVEAMAEAEGGSRAEVVWHKGVPLTISGISVWQRLA